MPSKEEKERRRKIKMELREKARKDFAQSLPMARNQFLNLFNFLDEKLQENGCNHTLQFSEEFLTENNIENASEVLHFLQQNGGYCDCEVLANVEEKFDEDAIL